MQSAAAPATDSGPAVAGVVLALFAPCLLAFNLPPSPTLLNQCAAVGLWGACVATTAASAVPVRPRAAWALIGACAVLAIGIVLGSAFGPLPGAIGGASLALVGCVIVVIGLGIAMASSRSAIPVMVWFLTGLAWAGGLSAVIACIQVFTPDLADGSWIAPSGMPGRAVGNLRQPNHLSSLLLWSLIATTGLLELRRLRLRVAVSLAAFLVFALVLSASRTGVLGTLLLALWGLVDRRLSRPARALLLASPAIAGLAWAGLTAWAHASSQVVGAETRLAFGSGGDISSSRFAIWSNALAMVAREPFAGVGFGEFNLAWTLTAFPDRPVAFFDHTHNLPLQLAVELGLPAAAVVLGLLAIALVQAWQRAWRADSDAGVARRTAFMIVLMIGLHSQLEYPLWYAYFLLPTAFAWGYALAEPRAAPASTVNGAPRSRWLAFAGVVMILGAIAATLDYRRVVVIYAPPDDAAPLEDRIARGQRSPLFAHHADYAAATAFGEPKAPLSPSQVLAFERAPHHLLDVRLMVAWAQALAAQGEVDKGRWLAARIREFRNPGSDEFFAPCALPAEATQAFQCQAPRRAYQWREFTRD
jgi:Virulence factor membrane-bound polymerase, C-terminal/O-Antigen ligase/Protein glycosylation ligase